MTEDELFEFLLEHRRVGHLDDGAHRQLHAVDETLEPHLDVSRGNHRIGLEEPTHLFHELDALALLREHLQHLRLVHLVEGDLGEGVEETGLEVRRDRLRVRSERQNLQQRRVGDEVEARNSARLVSRNAVRDF